ncbi:hypothetical protein BA177_04460 [Woeseia oceani]|uniref:Uncharacterized protein n=1 Tax=Woeseia oceani TaxID=1548547 RepID=A0A193LDP7_9GAMM|nr:hypothetical protein BA177_04460 [Woeseia oceani]
MHLPFLLRLNSSLKTLPLNPLETKPRQTCNAQKNSTECCNVMHESMMNWRKNARHTSGSYETVLQSAYDPALDLYRLVTKNARIAAL